VTKWERNLNRDDDTARPADASEVLRRQGTRVDTEQDEPGAIDAADLRRRHHAARNRPPAAAGRTCSRARRSDANTERGRGHLSATTCSRRSRRFKSAPTSLSKAARHSMPPPRGSSTALDSRVTAESSRRRDTGTTEAHGRLSAKSSDERGDPRIVEEDRRGGVDGTRAPS